MDTTMVLLRAVHVVSGIFWGGTLLFVAVFLVPAVRGAGPAGPKVMRQLVKVRKFPGIIGMFSAFTVLSGAWMYWRDNSLSGGVFARSTAGMTYGVGAIFSILTAIIAVTLVARTGEKIIALGDQVEAGGAPPTPEQAAIGAALGKRMLLGARLGATCIVIAALAMATARYL